MKAKQTQRLVMPDAVLDAVLCQSKVSESPHSFYKYPARFAPSFAREIIRAFSKEGELVLDPFCGGGTTLLEAMSLGRRVTGMDVSALATFIARAKTTPISVHDRRAIERWCDAVAMQTPPDCHEKGRLPKNAREHYERNLPDRVRAFLSWAITKIERMDKPRQKSFTRLILLSVGQWALERV